jgi:hypothetical protein
MGNVKSKLKKEKERRQTSRKKRNNDSLNPNPNQIQVDPVHNGPSFALPSGSSQAIPIYEPNKATPVYQYHGTFYEPNQETFDDIQRNSDFESSSDLSMINSDIIDADQVTNRDTNGDILHVMYEKAGVKSQVPHNGISEDVIPPLKFKNRNQKFSDLTDSSKKTDVHGKDNPSKHDPARFGLGRTLFKDDDALEEDTSFTDE